MANYIQSNILFQAYVHIDADHELVEDDANARRYLESYIEDRAKHFLDPSVSTTLEFKSGSIKAYATVRGTLKSCLPPAYSSFTVAVDQLYWFTKRLSDAAVMELSFKTNSYLAAIGRTEARPGIIGRTKHTLDGFHALPRDFQFKKRAELTRKMKRLLSNCTRLLAVLPTEEDRELISSEFYKLLKRIPPEVAQERELKGRLTLQYEKAYEALDKLLSGTVS